MSDETKPSPGPWTWDGIFLRSARGLPVCVVTYAEQADRALITDAWQLPQLREENRAMLELLGWLEPMVRILAEGQRAPERKLLLAKCEDAKRLLDKPGRG